MSVRRAQSLRANWIIGLVVLVLVVSVPPVLASPGEQGGQTPQPSPSQTPTFTPSPTATETPTETFGPGTPTPTWIITYNPIVTATPTSPVTATVAASDTPTSTEAPVEVIPTETDRSPVVTESPTPEAPTEAATDIPAPAAATETTVPAVAPAVTDAPSDDGDAGNDGGESGAGFSLPPQIPLIMGWAALLVVVIAYSAGFIGGHLELRRYAKGFPLDECPVCQQGYLELDENIRHVLGVPRIQRSVRCDVCRSVLREVKPGRWRYTIDPLINPGLAEGYNLHEFNDEELSDFAREAREYHPDEELVAVPDEEVDPEQSAQEIVSELEARFNEETAAEEARRAAEEAAKAEAEADEDKEGASDEESSDESDE